MIVVAGEALVDLTPAGEATHTFVAHPGGSPYNVAVALGRLEIPAGFLGSISSDPFGRLLREHLVDSGVSSELVVPAAAPTPVALAHLDGVEAQYSFYSEGTAIGQLHPEQLPPLPPGAMLHTGSIALVLEPPASTLEGLLRAESGRRLVSLDPNVRPAVIPDRTAYLHRLAGWLDLVDIAKVSEADLAWLYPDEPPGEVATRWLAAGAGLVLITTGGQGATAYQAGHKKIHVPAPTVPVVDTIGAGDAFTAGALAWLAGAGISTRSGLTALTRDDLATLVGFANVVAAQTCTRPGADPPRRRDLLTRPATE